MVIRTVKAATRKRTSKVRSNSHTGQSAGSISPDHSQGQMLVETLALPGVARHINKFLRKTTQKWGSGLAIHTSGLNCHWLLSGNCFGGHDIFGILRPQLLWPQNRPVWQSLYSGPEQKCPQLLRPTPGSGLHTRGPKSGHLASFHR